MGQGRRQRGPALASAGQRPVRRASLRLFRSRPAALGPRGLRLADPVCKGVWPAEVDGAPAAGVGGPPRPGMCGRPALAGRGRRHAVRGGQGPPQPGTRWRPALAGRGRRCAGCGGRGTTAARHALAPRSRRPRSTARRLRGSGDHHCPAPAGAPLRPAEVEDAPAAGVGGLPQPGTRGRPRSGPPRSRGGTPLCPAEKGGEVKNGACHLSRNNA